RPRNRAGRYRRIPPTLLESMQMGRVSFRGSRGHDTRPCALGGNPMRLETGDDDALDRVEEQLPRIFAAAKTDHRALGRRRRGFGKVSELVLDQMVERDLEIVAQAILHRRIERRRKAAEGAPAEARVTDLVRVDLGEELAKLAVRHLDPLRADE